MKTLLKISIQISFIVFTLSALAQDDISTKVSSAIDSGNSRELAKHFHTNIDLTIIDNDGTYSKAQAEIIVRDFFSKNPPSGFSINHQGSSRDASQYYIGTYTSKSNERFRVYFLLKSFSGKFLIQQLQIQKQ